MPEITYVILNTLWISGLSVTLTVLGIVYFLASECHQSMGKVFDHWKYRFFVNLGLFLLCGGLLGLAGLLWEKILWGFLAAGIIFDTYWDRIEQSRNRNRTHFE
jgi:hypothetical protein